MNNRDKIFALGYAVFVFIGLILVLLLPANLSPSTYSNYAFYLACSNFLSLVLFEWLRQIQLRFPQGSLYTAGGQSFRPGIIANYLTLLSSLLALIVFAIGFEIIGLVLALGVTQGLFEYRQSILRTNNLAIPYSIFTILRVSFLFSAVLLLFNENTSLSNALFITLSVFAACALLQCIFLAKAMREFYDLISLSRDSPTLPTIGQILYGFNSSLSSIVSVGVSLIIRRILLLIPSPETQALAIFIFELCSRSFNFTFNGIILVAQQKIFQDTRLGANISFQIWHLLAGVFIGVGGLALCMASLPILTPYSPLTPASVSQIDSLLFVSIFLLTFLSGVRHSFIKLMAQKNFTTDKNRDADLMMASLVALAWLSISFLEPEATIMGLILIVISGIQYFLAQFFVLQGHRISSFLFLPLPFCAILFCAAEFHKHGHHLTSHILLFFIAFISSLIIFLCGNLLRQTVASN